MGLLTRHQQLHRLHARLQLCRTLLVTSKTGKHVSSPFFSHQSALPFLPVPPLKQTLDKYLKTLQPLITENDLKKTKGIVEAFSKTGGHGEELQNKLIERAKQRENWLSDWWLDVAYLASRATVVIHCSPCVTLPQNYIKGNQIERAAKVIAGMINFKDMIDNGTLPKEKLGNRPLCMEQYFNLYSTCRIPGVVKDSVECFQKSLNPPKHICVAFRNNFYELTVYSDNSPLTVSQLKHQLQKIVDSPAAPGLPVGILTSANRDFWGQSYQELSSNPDNRVTLDSIQRSIFTVCLDDPMPDVSTEEWRNSFTGQCLHGGGSHLNTGNRWFDKTLQMVFDTEGGVGMCYEHSPAEGPPIAAMVDHVCAYSENLSTESEGDEGKCGDLDQPKLLKFTVNDKVKSDIEQANKDIDALINHLNLHVEHFDDFGKDFIKSQKLSPDSFIQIAFQLAYFQLHKHAPATYESGSLRQFRLGRTDTIRSCSSASDEFTKGFTSGKLGIPELQKLLRAAVAEHKNYVVDTVGGNGIDRHLLGLKLTALEAQQETPELFNDPSYKRMMHFNLSTSQVGAKSEMCLGFGPAVDDGYGLCYNPKPGHIMFSVSSFKTNPDYDVKRMGKQIAYAMNAMKDLLLASNVSKL